MVMKTESSDPPLSVDVVENVEALKVKVKAKAKAKGWRNRRRIKRSVSWRRQRLRWINEFAKTTIMDEHPVYLLEHDGYLNFLRTKLHIVSKLMVKFNRKAVSFERIVKECYSIYLEEKRKLLNLLSEVPGRISLSLDFSGSSRFMLGGYALVRVHFMDNNWKSQCHILDVVKIEYGAKDDLINQAVMACLFDWQLDGRLFSITIDQPLLDYTIVENLNPPAADFLKLNCLARIVRQLAQDALSSTTELVGKIRETAKFCKYVPMDLQGRWDTTYRMLAAACERNQVFSSCSPDPDSDITSLSMDDWKQANSVCTYLNYFLDVAAILTANATVETARVLFLQVSKIQMELTRGSMSEDSFVRDLTKPLKHKFDEYWRDARLGLAIAAVMDPSFKLSHVKLTFYKVCVDFEEAKDWTNIVHSTLHRLFNVYNLQPQPQPHQTCNQSSSSELGRYLENPLSTRSQDLGVLTWWRNNQQFYPILSKMARDILSMPLSTAASHVIFDTDTNLDIKRINNSFPTSTLRVFICTRDWLKFGSSPSTS